MNFKEWLLAEEIKGVRNIYKNLLDFLKERPEELYVNFSTSPRFENNPVKNPSHHDPVGIYAFPKNYILKDTAGNEVFFGMPYISVFKLKENAKILNLSNITEEEARTMLKKMGIEDYIEKEYFRNKGPKGGHTLWHTMEKYIALNKLSKNITWNKLFKMVDDFDVIKDEGDKIIHSNEPEQIVVLNKNVIETVKKIENPYQTYVSSFFSNIADVAKEIGEKYFKDYYIEQMKKDDRKASPKNLYHNAAFYVISKNKQLPYSISFFYSNGNLFVTLVDPYNNRKELAEKKYETRGVSITGYTSKSWADDPAMLEKEFDKNELMQEIEKNLQIHLKPLEQDIEKEATELLIEINKQLNVPKPQIVKFKNNSAYKEFTYEAGVPIKFKITINSDFKNKTYVIFEWTELRSLSVYPRKSSYPFTFPTAPSNVNPMDVIHQLKMKLEENMQHLSKIDVFSSLYNDKKITENLLKSFFK